MFKRSVLIFEPLLALFIFVCNFSAACNFSSWKLHISTNIAHVFVCVCFRLQTGMRGAFGKPQGTVARVHIGQPIMSVRAREQHEASIVEALRRAKFKYPGRQKVRWRLEAHCRDVNVLVILKFSF